MLRYLEDYGGKRLLRKVRPNVGLGAPTNGFNVRPPVSSSRSIFSLVSTSREEGQRRPVGGVTICLKSLSQGQTIDMPQRPELYGASRGPGLGDLRNVFGDDDDARTTKNPGFTRSGQRIPHAPFPWDRLDLRNSKGLPGPLRSTCSLQQTLLEKDLFFSPLSLLPAASLPRFVVVVGPLT